MTTVWQYDGQSTTVQAAARAALAAAQTALAANLTAPGSAAAAVAVALPPLAVAPDDALGYAAALAKLLTDYVAGIVGDAATAATPDPTLLPGYADASRLPPLPLDPSQGLAALAAFGPAPASATGIVLANWTALIRLVGSTATAALQMLYAQTAFASAGDAASASAQLYGLIQAQIDLAAADDDDTIVQAWLAAQTAAVTDLAARGEGLPNLATFTAAAPLPALYLAQRLYQDGSQAAALVQRNAAPHPLFMPLAVEYLDAGC
jgi:hypothetical protein